MGVHICVVNNNGEEHPDWDWIRYAGDRDMATEIGSSWPRIANPSDPFLGYIYRPEPHHTLKGERGETLMNILKDPQWSVHLCY